MSEYEFNEYLEELIERSNEISNHSFLNPVEADEIQVVGVSEVRRVENKSRRKVNWAKEGY